MELDDVDVESIDRDADFSNIEKKLKAGSGGLPSITPPKSDDPRKKRINRAACLPQYVWEQLKAKSKETDDPQNVIIMKALKNNGFDIDDSDLVDQRTIKKSA